MRKSEAQRILDEYRRIPALIAEARLEQATETEIKSPQYGGTPKGKGQISDPTGNLAVKRADRNKRIDYLQRKYQAVCNAAAGSMTGVYLVFLKIYDEGMCIDTLAHELGLPRRRIEALHKELVDDIAEYYVPVLP